MYKIIFISFLLVALINFLVGCYSSELVTVTVPEYEQVEEKEGKPNEIYVKTKDSQGYHFPESNFYIENDTLYGKASVRGEVSFEGKFAFWEIESIQIGNFGVTVSHYQKIEAESGKPDEIYLTKNDFTKYHFMKDDYYIENDTLYGKGKLILDGQELLDRNISLSEIESIKFDSSDLRNPIPLILLVTVTLVVVIYLAIDSIKIPFGN